MSTNEYMRRYMNRRYQKRKRAAIKALGGKCAKCGSRRRLQFDHRDRRKKKFTIGKFLVSVSEQKLKKELKKCQLLCWYCHNAKTQKELGRNLVKTRNGLIHGSYAAYNIHKCRCNKCRAAKAAYMKKYRKKPSNS